MLDVRGNELARFAGQIEGDRVKDPWVSENIVPVVDLPRFDIRIDLLNAFWDFWMANKANALCVADFGAPVEAGLLRACVGLDPGKRTWEGPYPMHELGTALLLSGNDPDLNRREFIDRPNLVQHDPVDDALTAGLCWLKVTPALYNFR